MCGNGSTAGPPSGGTGSTRSAWIPTRATAAPSKPPASEATSPRARRSPRTRPRIVGLANRALDDTRRRTQTDTLGYRGRKDDPLYQIPKLLLTGAERLGPASWQRMAAGLDADDPHEGIAECWAAKEHVRDVFRAADPDTALARLADALDWCEHPHAAPELAKLARTLRRWETEIGTAVRTGTSNGRTEAANARIKDIKRSARGFRNFANCRHRIILAAGQQPCQTQPVTRIRTRRPRSDT